MLEKDFNTRKLRDDFSTFERMPIAAQTIMCLTAISDLLRILRSEGSKAHVFFKVEYDYPYGGAAFAYANLKVNILDAIGNEHPLDLENEISELRCLVLSDAVSREASIGMSSPGVFFQITDYNLGALKKYMFRLIRCYEKMKKRQNSLRPA